MLGRICWRIRTAASRRLLVAGSLRIYVSAEHVRLESTDAPELQRDSFVLIIVTIQAALLKVCSTVV